MKQTTPRHLRTGLRQDLHAGIRRLRPGVFGSIMATGIVSIAANQQGMHVVAHILLWINIAAYVILAAFVVVRLTRHFNLVVTDFLDHTNGPGFFTVTAGSCVLGSQLLELYGATIPATILLIVGSATWLVLTYAFFAVVTLRATKPTLDRGIDGTWLLAVVATQSVAYLGASLWPHLGRVQAALFLPLALWLAGAVLYGLIMPLIFYRLAFFRVTPADLTGSYWINMGALAITTLTGSRLLQMTGQWFVLRDIRPFLEGCTLLFWAAGTWWIPLLIILGVWRHALMRYPLRYDEQYWAIVFPLGMYTASTFALARVTGITILSTIPRFSANVALITWVAISAGLAAVAFRPLFGER